MAVKESILDLIVTFSHNFPVLSGRCTCAQILPMECSYCKLKEEREFWMSPRIAFALYLEAAREYHNLSLYIEGRINTHTSIDRLPAFTRAYLNTHWVSRYRKHFHRIQKTLRSGLPPYPTCFAEELALDYLIERARISLTSGEIQKICGVTFDLLPKTKSDLNMQFVRECLLEVSEGRLELIREAEKEMFVNSPTFQGLNFLYPPVEMWFKKYLWV